MANHGIVAAEFQWKAAQQGLLSTVIVPLDPQPRKEGNTWVWPCEPIDLFWFDSESVGERLLKKLHWQIGDRIFLQEEWCKGDWGAAFDDDIYFTKSTTPEAENIGWQPAETMPAEAAQYWFEATGVRVVQMKNISASTVANSGIKKLSELNGKEGAFEKFWKTTKQCWNAAHPNYPWESDRHVVLLNVKPLENENA